MSYTYFSQWDFDNASPPCSIHDMNSKFMERIDNARRTAGVAFIVNSAYRTVDHELSRDRNGKSSHTKGVALDIRANDSRNRYIIVKALLDAGFTRIGIHKSFIHVDADKDKDQRVVFIY